MKYVSLNFKYNEKILALYYTFYYNGYFLVPFLEKEDLKFVDLDNSLYLDDWVITTIKNYNDFKEWLGYKFEIFNKKKVFFNDESIELYYFDLGQLILYLIDDLNEEVLRKFEKFLFLEDSDIYAIMKLKESSDELNLPYFIYQTKEYHYTFGRINNKYYISLKFPTLDKYLKYLEEVEI